MARIRTIKPEFWTDERIGECSMSARLLFIAAWNFADDQGGLDRSSKQLKAQAFPYDVIDCEPLVQELIRQGLLVEYEANGRKYLHINGFLKHQKIDKPAKPRIPPYEGSEIKSDQSPNPPRALATEGKGREGKGKEGRGNSDARAPDPGNVPRGTPQPIFDGVQFYELNLRHPYPRHDLTDTDVMQAGRALEVLVSEDFATVGTLIERTESFRAQQDAAGNTDTKFVMKPAKFYGSEGHWRGPFAIAAQPKKPGEVDPVALAAWDALIASDGAKRDSAVQRGIDAVGGWSVIAERNKFDTVKIRAAFCAAYIAARAAA